MSGRDESEHPVILALEHIGKTYPGVVALDDVSVDFRRGEVHALLGENGAGKSTLIKTISGAIRPEGGRILIDGRSLDHLTPPAARRLGIEVIYQEFNLVPTLTVAENVCLGEYDGWRADFPAYRRKCAALMADLEVDISPDTLVRDLPSAGQQLVEIAKALAKSPRLLIMDEPTAPLSLSEVETLFRIVRKIRDQGTSVVYISHRLDEIFDLSDRVTVLRDGRYIATRRTADTNRDELIALMVGRMLSETYPPKAHAPGEVALELKGLAGNGNEAMFFALRQGEIVGVAGLIGAGRTELAKLIVGAASRDGGVMELYGRPVRFHSPREAIAAGVGLIPENRKEEGCFLGQSIRWNVSIAALRRVLGRFGIRSNIEIDLAERYFRMLRIKAPGIETAVVTLSGGNQQKVVIAKTLASEARVLIFDEPTRGIDVGARGEIYKLMVDLAATGIAILMITSDMEELLGMSDRILVLHEGRMTGLLPRADCSQEKIMALASGLTGN
jgi:ABC-type sugar transport system ATPase subunit